MQGPLHQNGRSSERSPPEVLGVGSNRHPPEIESGQNDMERRSRYPYTLMEIATRWDCCGNLVCRTIISPHFGDTERLKNG
ncbi:hypothetical protein T05_3257 [Trichinella murrelli]|uniref:Uncharacterized protein n=1 Tax=Trichinella murrelli TaxID=144512 RepID=A0A0V0TAG2_9BILA|nr:hypothetical protein T05_3257 [Trichinella murrelli]